MTPPPPLARLPCLTCVFKMLPLGVLPSQENVAVSFSCCQHYAILRPRMGALVMVGTVGWLWHRRGRFTIDVACCSALLCFAFLACLHCLSRREDFIYWFIFCLLDLTLWAHGKIPSLPLPFPSCLPLPPSLPRLPVWFPPSAMHSPSSPKPIPLAQKQLTPKSPKPEARPWEPTQGAHEPKMPKIGPCSMILHFLKPERKHN